MPSVILKYSVYPVKSERTLQALSRGTTEKSKEEAESV
jgi:hypothetical protein